MSFLLFFAACQMRKQNAFLLNQKNLLSMSILFSSWFYRNLQFVSWAFCWISQSFNSLLKLRFHFLCWNLFLVNAYQLVFFVWFELFLWMLEWSFRFLAFKLLFIELDFCSAAFLLYLISCETLSQKRFMTHSQASFWKERDLLIHETVWLLQNSLLIAALISHSDSNWHKSTNAVLCAD